MVIFKLFGQNYLKLELSTFVVHKILTTYRTQRGRYQVNFRRENKPLSEF